MLQKLTIKGLRGFASAQSLEFAIPGHNGLGLTVIVGANNTGKSTIIEAIRALTSTGTPSFSQGRRNISAGDMILITIQDTEGKQKTITSVRPGSSETILGPDQLGDLAERVLVLPPRRVFSAYFNRSVSSRRDYMTQIGFPAVRSSQLDQFAYRLFKIEKDGARFSELLRQVLGYDINWSIDQADNGQYFLKINSGQGAFHTSEGMGDGLISLMYIVDALHDSEPGNMIVVDEPELSLHPQYQRNLFSVFRRYAKDRQIVISTHSPYFVDLGLLENGLKVYRSTKQNDGIKILGLGDNTAGRLSKLVRNQNNPHILGITAREILFAGEGVLLLEGQEDVVFLDRVVANLKVDLSVATYGWGVGGAGNMRTVAQMLADLGFKKVVGILDVDKDDLLPELRKEMPTFHFDVIPAKDIRTKEAVKAKAGVKGLLDDKNKVVRPEYVDDTNALFQRVNTYLTAA